MMIEFNMVLLRADSIEHILEKKSTLNRVYKDKSVYISINETFYRKNIKALILHFISHKSNNNYIIS